MKPEQKPIWYGREKQLFRLAAPAAVLLFGLLGWIGAPLVTGESPLGIMSFELAGSYADAAEMMVLWNETTRLLAAFSLGLDYVFMPAYAAAIGLGCLLVSRSWPARLAGFSRLAESLARGQWVAALLDVVENIALLQLLLGSKSNGMAQLAFWCALVKFILIGLGLAYAAVGGVFAGIKKLR